MAILREVMTDQLIDELQIRGFTVVPGGNERARGEIVVRADDEVKEEATLTIGVVEGLTIRQWQERIHAWALGKGWWEDEDLVNIPEKLMLMVSELSEALEDFRNSLPLRVVTFEGDGGKPCGFPTELADTVIRILDFCGYFGIDLENVMHIKHAYNVTRPRRHGGKVC